MFSDDSGFTVDPVANKQNNWAYLPNIRGANAAKVRDGKTQNPVSVIVWTPLRLTVVLHAFSSNRE